MKKKIRSFILNDGDNSLIKIIKHVWSLIGTTYVFLGFCVFVGAFASWEGISARTVATTVVMAVCSILLLYDSGNIANRGIGFYIWKTIVGITTVAWHTIVLFNGEFFIGSEYGGGGAYNPLLWWLGFYTIGALVITICMILLIVTDEASTPESKEQT